MQSCGAEHATFIELNTPSLTALKENVASLNAEAQCTVQRYDALRFVAALEPDAFDVALADPPFAGDFAERLVASWQAVPFAPVLAVEHSSKVTIPGGETLHADRRQLYMVFPDGMGPSKAAVLAGRMLPGGTARNWNTVLKLDAAAATS